MVLFGSRTHNEWTLGSGCAVDTRVWKELKEATPRPRTSTCHADVSKIAKFGLKIVFFYVKTCFQRFLNLLSANMMIRVHTEAFSLFLSLLLFCDFWNVWILLSFPTDQGLGWGSTSENLRLSEAPLSIFGHLCLAQIASLPSGREQPILWSNLHNSFLWGS